MPLMVDCSFRQWTDVSDWVVAVLCSLTFVCGSAFIPHATVIFRWRRACYPPAGDLSRSQRNRSCGSARRLLEMSYPWRGVSP